MQALKRRIAQEIDSGQPAAPSMSSLWQRLAELWRVIDGGDPYLGVPAYDGGLFKPANHPFLEQHRVGDLHLRKAIDLLARTLDPRPDAARLWTTATWKSATWAASTRGCWSIRCAVAPTAGRSTAEGQGSIANGPSRR